MRHSFKAKLLVLAICLCTLAGLFLWLRLADTQKISGSAPRQHNGDVINPRAPDTNKLIKKLFGHLPPGAKPGLMLHVRDSVHEQVESKDSEDTLPDYNVHVFYYMWYGNPDFDGGYIHWNHPYLPHWNKREDMKWPKGRHEPPGDVGSSFEPALGAYSSQDPAVLETHMQQIRQAGAGVLAVSWYPPGMSDDNGRPVDPHIPLLLDAANKYHLKVCFHIEPYKGRDPENVRQNLAYISERYGDHPAFYRRLVKGGGYTLPVYYIYDSYLIPAEQWASLLVGASSVRHTKLDAIFLGLLVESRQKADILTAGFDGFYTYFASHGFTYGSTQHSWMGLANFAAVNRLLFVPSVGPGYVDTSVRPWNAHSTRNREDGAYYERSWKAAVSVHPPVISVTSFNEWHEGSQIEPAKSQPVHGQPDYLSYLPRQPDYYLKLTRKWVELYRNSSNTIALPGS